MIKQLVFKDTAREELWKGIDQVASAVRATLGPGGRTVILEQNDGVVTTTKDGVSVAKSIKLEDPVWNIGGNLIKQASIKTAEKAGDGTTTSTVLAADIVERGIKEISNGYVNTVALKEGLDFAKDFAVENIKKFAVEVSSNDQLKQIATISANGDEKAGELISSAMEEVGLEGVVTIEESPSGETVLDLVEGMQFDRGYKSPYFVTDNATMTTTLKNARILITDKTLSTVKELLPIMEKCSSDNVPLVVIAEDVVGETLSTLIVNKTRKSLSSVAIKAPGFGDNRKAMLEDIAVLTGGTVVSKDKGMKFTQFNENWLGRAKRVTVGKHETTIVDAQGDEKIIKEYVDSIKEQIENEVSPYAKEQLQNRLAQMIGGVAVVKVGGFTEIEMKERKDRIEDALHATKAALEEGILPGGGTALLKISNELQGVIAEFKSENKNEDFIKGLEIFNLAIKEPFFWILKNAGVEDTKSILRSIMEEKSLWIGYNPILRDKVEMLESGIIDPAKVTRLAIENAVSVAGTILTTEAVVYNLKEEESDNQPIPGFDI